MAGALLVAAQFGLIGLVAWLVGLPKPAPPALLLGAASVALGLWTLAHNRPGNFNIRPVPKADATLITSGPYRHVRHPMYVSLLLFLAGLVAAAPTLAAWTAFAALVAVLATKARLEEAFLRERFSDYADYATRTRRFVPGIW